MMVTANPLVPAELPASVRLEQGHGGLAKVVVGTAAATAEIYLQGAHVTAWAPTGLDPVIWMSQHSAFAPGSPIRGGVPVCFPWFGPHPSATAPLHGFARISQWTLADVAEQGEDVALTFTLLQSGATQTSAWPHPFAARYTVTVGRTLRLSLEVANVGAETITFAEAFHTYLAVRDIRGVTITGLEGSAHVDRLVNPEWVAPSGVPRAITGETDLVYAQPGMISIADPAGSRSLKVTATGSANAVIWNPWIAKSAAMGDFGDQEWQGMLCVETANVLDGAVTLAPGQAHTMTATITAAGD